MPAWDELFATSIGVGEVGLRLVFAAVLGFVIGLDREIRHKPLGLRSFMLVSIGAALFAVVVVELVATFAQAQQTEIDPSRVIQGIVGGIGFLGAGAIIQARGEVIGGTTGATIWAVGGIGMACGFGYFLHALLATAAALFVLVILGFAERVLGKGRGPEG